MNEDENFKREKKEDGAILLKRVKACIANWTRVIPPPPACSLMILYLFLTPMLPQPSASAVSSHCLDTMLPVKTKKRCEGKVADGIGLIPSDVRK